MTVHADVLSLFNALVVAPHRKIDTYSTELISQGVVTDFIPSAEDQAALRSILKPLTVRTLFSREERMTASLTDLLVKQFLHYIEIYGLDAPGLFDLEVDSGKLVTLRYVQGITVEELGEKVRALLYSNAPVKDASQLQRIIDHYGLSFDINEVANNELRILLWSPTAGAFKNGDDAVRWLCWRATGSPMLIKSKEVITQVKYIEVKPDFFEQHAVPLAQVFNRHKRIILAAKNRKTATAINRIARLSKTQHVPLQESIAKTFVAKALAGEAGMSALKKVTVRDKFKYLNLLAEKRLQRDSALYRVRNGKVFHKKEGVTTYDLKNIERVEAMVLESLKADLHHLRTQNILLPADVDYGLPVSRKQTLGRLPFGTKVSVDSNEISSGMYWENEWGARDLDLSAIDQNGSRVGWGGYRGYTDEAIVFSGDVTDAPDGAMEFMTSRNQTYGLIINIYAGREGSEFELVVGRNSKTKSQWMEDTVIRERHSLESRNCIIGFVKGREFVVYAGRAGNRRVSTGSDPVLNAMITEFWTVKRLFDALGINFDVDSDGEIEYNADLSYEAFSFDKLEDLFKTTA